MVKNEKLKNNLKYILNEEQKCISFSETPRKTIITYR